ncbi:MAG: hypothetical protein MUQ32_02775, partial [Chloroflexi bacterium]|nr:hypothetical protein [Chloroflexota bacterium]
MSVAQVLMAPECDRAERRSLAFLAGGAVPEAYVSRRVKSVATGSAAGNRSYNRPNPASSPIQVRSIPWDRTPATESRG